MESNEKSTRNEFGLGMKVRTKIPFFDLPQGSIGEIVEDYGTGFMIEWQNRNLRDGFNKETELDFLELL